MAKGTIRTGPNLGTQGGASKALKRDAGQPGQKGHETPTAGTKTGNAPAVASGRPGSGTATATGTGGVGASKALRRDAGQSGQKGYDTPCAGVKTGNG